MSNALTYINTLILVNMSVHVGLFNVTQAVVTLLLPVVWFAFVTLAREAHGVES